MVADSTPFHDRNGERWTDLVDQVGESLQQHIPASPKPSRGSEMGWGYVLGPLTGLYVCHGLLSYLVVWSSQLHWCRAAEDSWVIHSVDETGAHAENVVASPYGPGEPGPRAAGSGMALSLAACRYIWARVPYV